MFQGVFITKAFTLYDDPPQAHFLFDENLMKHIAEKCKLARLRQEMFQNSLDSDFWQANVDNVKSKNIGFINCIRSLFVSHGMFQAIDR
jgi:hypothetical protein